MSAKSLNHDKFVTERNISLSYTGEAENDYLGALLPEEEVKERAFLPDKVCFFGYLRLKHLQ
jgi:hypothetical protein